MDHSDTPVRLKPQGIGARVPRKEDARHLAGKGRFVGDMTMPGLCDVAFLRSPLAHARIVSVQVPDEVAEFVFLREEMRDALDMVAESTLPT
jgi:carbon-monoxide dehydrogenase large subunit